MKKPITIILLVMLSARVLHARHMRNFQFWEFPILGVWISMDDGQRECTRPRLVFSLACLTA
jgi:hypothetical protein